MLNVVVRFRMSLLIRSLFQPIKVFRMLADPDSAAVAQVLRYALFLIFLPPLFAYLGFRWYRLRLAAEKPLFYPGPVQVVIIVSYRILIRSAFLSTVIIANWKANTYAAQR